MLFSVVLTLAILAGWWVWEFRRAWRRPVPREQVRRVPPRPAQIRRREVASVADEAERIIREELRVCIREGRVPARMLLDDRDR